jgi:hypothetical protein
METYNKHYPFDINDNKFSTGPPSKIKKGMIMRQFDYGFEG